MRVRVKLLGTLPAYCLKPCPPAGLELDLPEGSTLGDLVAALDLPREKVGLASINEVLARADDLLPADGLVKLMHSLAGG